MKIFGIILAILWLMQIIASLIIKRPEFAIFGIGGALFCFWLVIMK